MSGSEQERYRLVVHRSDGRAYAALAMAELYERIPGLIWRDDLIGEEVEPNDPRDRPGLALHSPDVFQIGEALVTSGTLAAVIVAYLKRNRTEVLVTFGEGERARSVKYRGPNFGKDARELEALIERLARSAASEQITIRQPKRASEPKGLLGWARVSLLRRKR